MKKNFFKKLALVMALAVTVTSVPATNASAAAAPTFKSKAVTVNVGQTKKYSTANSAKYSVKFKIGNTKVATIKYSAGSKSVKVTGVASGKSTLRADFKSYSTKKTTTVKVPVTVKEDVAAIKSVEAAGVKKVVVTFNKAVDKEKAVVTIKKGTSSPSVASTTFAEDMKSVTINMGSKLTEGTYDVSVTGLTEAALAGSITVKNETLTSVELVGTNLIADPAIDKEGTLSHSAKMDFKTLNQYGERMTVSNPNVSCTFGKAEVTKTCTATANGVVTVKEIPTTLQIIGTSGSIVLVQPDTGISVNTTVTYAASATAKTMTVAGLYNTSDEKIMDMSGGDSVGDFVILATIEDQYGNALTASRLNDEKNGITTTIAPNAGVTGVATTNDTAKRNVWTDMTIDGKDYVALQLLGDKAEAGTFNLTFVNPKAGLLANQSFTVSAGTFVKSLSVSATDSIYSDIKSELAFEAVDAEGNAITDYAKLKDLIGFTLASGTGTVAFEKQANGSAKLFFTPKTSLTVGSKNSTVVSFTATANKPTSTNYLVKPLTFTVYAKKVPKVITGVKSDVATAMAMTTGASITIKTSELVIEDQYSNVMSDVSMSDIGFESNSVFTVEPSTTDKNYKFTLKTPGTAQESKVKFFIKDTTDKDGQLKNSSAEITVSAVDTQKASDIKISSIMDGDVVKYDEMNLFDNNKKVSVTGKVSGKLVSIPESQFVVSGNTGYNLGEATSSNPAQTVTGTIEVTVDTKNGPVVTTKDYSFSNANPTVTKIEKKEVENVAKAETLTNTQFVALFNIKDQYGDAITAATILKTVKYDVTNVSDNKAIVITHNATNDVKVTGAVKDDKLTITASKGTQTAVITVNIVD